MKRKSVSFGKDGLRVNKFIKNKKSKLLDNWGLKLGSVLFAIALWIIVTNINDPVINYRVYNVPVSLKNTSLITNNGQVYEVLNGTDVIDVVTVSAPRSIIDALSDDNIVATADFGELTINDTAAIQLSTTKYADKVESIRGNIDAVQFNIENKKTAAFALTTTIAGSVDEGYMIGGITTDQNLVRVSGPESVVSRIKMAQVEVAVSGFGDDIVTDADIHLYDAEGEEVPQSSITMNIKNVKVNVDILQTARVPFNCHVMGEPATGYAATGLVNTNPENVLIAGDPDVINTVHAIDLPEDRINITGQSENMMVVIDAEDCLPAGIRLADASYNGKVTVEVEIAALETKVQSLRSSSIEVVGLTGDSSYVFEDAEPLYEVRFIGLPEDLEQLNADLIHAYIDVNELAQENDMESIESGTYEAKIHYRSDLNVKPEGTQTIMVQIEVAENMTEGDANE